LLSITEPQSEISYAHKKHVASGGWDSAPDPVSLFSYTVATFIEDSVHYFPILLQLLL